MRYEKGMSEFECMREMLMPRRRRRFYLKDSSCILGQVM